MLKTTLLPIMLLVSHSENGALGTVKCEKVKLQLSWYNDEPKTAQNVSFFLYTRRNARVGREVFKEDSKGLKNSHYSKEKKTKFIIHGWQGSSKTQLNPLIKDTFLRNYDVNVIVVDWSEYAKKSYGEAVGMLPEIAEQFASFIDWLTGIGPPAESFHIIGYSLGGQLAGFTGRRVKNGKIGYLTGLDPAKTLYEDNPDCVSSLDAAYVEIIHTNKNLFGIAKPRGHADFYPNWGEYMPGCSEDSCSHNRALDYFDESLENEGSFLAKRCRDYDEILEKKCSGPGRLNMGGSEPKTGNGVFYLRTNAEPPYSIN